MEIENEQQSLNVDVAWNSAIDQLRRGHGESHIALTKDVIDVLGHEGMVDIAKRYR